MLTGDASLTAFCDADGANVVCLRNDFRLVDGNATHLSQFAVREDRTKTLRFLDEVARQQVAFDWPINVALADGVRTLHFAGATHANGVLLIAAPGRAGILLAVQQSGSLERLRGCGEVTATICRAAAEQIRHDDSLLDELSLLNSELVSVQRQLHQRNAEVEALNEQLRGELQARQAAEEQTHRDRERITHMHRVSTMGEMATGLAHQLNQPLAAISLHAEMCATMLQQGPPADATKLSGWVQFIAEQAQRAGQIVSLLRRHVRKAAPRREPVDFQGVIDTVVQTLAPEFRKFEVSLAVDVADGLPSFHGDTVELEQILVNLIRNALEATAESNDERKVTVQVSCGSDNRTLEFAVSDTGPGFKPESLEKALDGFFTTKANGLGLGIAICRSLIESHGGHLSIHNSTQGGCTCSFSLPIDYKENDPHA